MPGGLDKVLSLRDCTKYFNVVDELNWDTLDKYEAHIRTVYYVEYNKKEWILSKCSCIFWAKNYFCHHVVGLAVENKKVQYLDVHKQIEIGRTRPRGQPKKTASALVRQDDYISSDTSESDSDSVDSEESSEPVKIIKKKTAAKRGPKPKNKKKL